MFAPQLVLGLALVLGSVMVFAPAPVRGALTGLSCAGVANREKQLAISVDPRSLVAVKFVLHFLRGT